MLTFMQSLLVSLIICAFSSFFVLFAKRFQTFMFGCFFFLTGIFLLLCKTDIDAGLKEGRLACLAIFFILLFEFVAYRFIRQKNVLFYGLPLLAFITLAISTDLITVLLGLMLFGLSFVLLARFKEKKNIADCFLKINVGLLCFSYGISVVFSRIGVLTLSDVRLQLSLKSDDEWMMFGFGLLCLGVVIELYAIFLSLKKVTK